MLAYDAPEVTIRALRILHAPEPKVLKKLETKELIGRLRKKAVDEDCEAQYDLAQQLHLQQFPAHSYSISMQGEARKWLIRSAESKARKVESKLISRAEEMGPSAVLRRAPLLADFAPRFLNWVDQAPALAPKTRRYYRIGWQLIGQTPVVAMTLDHITTEEVDSLALAGSPSYVNQALRTLRRLLGKAAEWKVIASAPRIRLVKEIGREQTIDPETESKLLIVAKQPLKDVLVIMQDTGLRPEEVFRIRIENIDWTRRVIFNPRGKTRASRRHVLISERMSELLMLRCAGKTEGWLFPSKRASDGHLTTVARQFQKARRAAGLPNSLVLYCARHTFGTAVYEATGNLALVMKAMGHSDVRTAMRYQHPALDSLREVIDQRNLRHNSRHSELRVQ